jgi:predicted metal-dependent phosphoesterase TrpH
MEPSNLIDLHTNTDRSGGNSSPQNLVSEAWTLGIEALAIADRPAKEGIFNAGNCCASDTNIEGGFNTPSVGTTVAFNLNEVRNLPWIHRRGERGPQE